ncbi:hypothetical protein [Actinophytocola gossypii]|uniref:Uncharacterized protein n=1 Tax=Actinophytocola gossypii TaxID=2812003 RepID=A0ABT2JG34_9PSEU|nr:hypothetical protein [Actinophytocola gossypii]MCT2586706.1 hypothetical protein [Actinophytocola gossypii]
MAGRLGNPFKQLVRNNFNEAEYAGGERAMQRMSEDPAPGEAPGVGRLIQAEP